MADALTRDASRGRRAGRGQATRERLLEAASRLFATQGFDATSVEAVADAAGITVPGMYRHFSTKHGLLLAVASWSARTSRARQALTQGPDLARGLADLFAEYLADGEIERRRLSIELSRAAYQDDELRHAVISFNERLRDSLAETIAAGLADAGLAGGDGDGAAGGDGDAREIALLSHFFLVLLMGGIHLDTLDAERIGDPRLIEFLHERFAVVLAGPGRAPAAVGRLPSSVADDTPEPEPADGRRARTVRTRRRILDAAHELFALHGYDATTTEMIAQRADITVPGLYRHVSSKEGLLVEVAERAFSRYRLADELRGDVGVAEQVADLLAAFSLGPDRVNRRLAIELDFGAWRSTALAESLRSFHRRVRRNVAAALAAEAGVEPGEEHELRALVLLMLFMGVAHLDTIDPSLLDDDGWIDVLRRRVPQLVG